MPIGTELPHASGRRFVIGVSVAVLAALGGARSAAPQPAAPAPPASVIDDLVAANRILANEASSTATAT